MDINDLRTLMTVLTFALFVAILCWAFSAKRKRAFEEAALLPFTADEPADPAYQRALIGSDERRAS